LKNLLKILILTFILVSCKKETESKTKFPKSDFNLKTDLTDFKKKMTELDTIKVFFDHSVCTYEGYERIEITKKSDSIKVRTEFKELTFNENQNPNWNFVYEKKISETDTVWQFDKFIERNSNRKTSDEKKRGILIVENKKDTIQFFTNGLVDLNHFLEDYYLTMRKIYPENKNGIYGYELVEE
jgi:PBP1b-binding outer membrane lipoprotein LpoB